jgi:hypothetical protein
MVIPRDLSEGECDRRILEEVEKRPVNFNVGQVGYSDTVFSSGD